MENPFVSRDTKRKAGEQLLVNVRGAWSTFVREVYEEVNDWNAIITAYRGYIDFALHTEPMEGFRLNFRIPAGNPERVVFEREMLPEEVVALISSYHSDFPTILFHLLIMDLDVEGDELAGIPDIPIGLLNIVNFRMYLRDQVRTGDLSTVVSLVPFLSGEEAKLLGDSIGRWVHEDYKACFREIVACETNPRLQKYRRSFMIIRLVARDTALSINPEIRPCVESVARAQVGDSAITRDELASIYIEIDNEVKRVFSEVTEILRTLRRPLRLSIVDSLYLRRLGVVGVSLSVGEEGRIQARVDLEDGLVFESKIANITDNDIQTEVELAIERNFPPRHFLELHAWINAFLVDLVRYHTAVGFNPKTYARRRKDALQIPRQLLRRAGFMNPLVVAETIAPENSCGLIPVGDGSVLELREYIALDDPDVLYDSVDALTAEVLPARRVAFYRRGIVDSRSELSDTVEFPPDTMHFNMSGTLLSTNALAWFSLTVYNQLDYALDWKFGMYVLANFSWVGALEVEMLGAL